MSKADEMFKELYYAKSGINNYSSEISVTTIDFLATYKEIRIDGHIGVKELQAISEKCKELRMDGGIEYGRKIKYDI